MKILTVNEICSNNIGDQAIGAGLNLAIQHVFGLGTEIYNFSLQKGSFPSVAPVRKAKTAESDSGDLKVSIARHSLWSFRYLYRLLFAMKTISKVDLVIVGGGSLVMNNKLQFPTALYICGLLFNIFNKPYAVSGVSMSGEINGVAHVLFARFLKGAIHVDMRDPISREKGRLLFSLEIAQGSDYAFLLDYDAPSRVKNTSQLDFLTHDGKSPGYAGVAVEV